MTKKGVKKTIRVFALSSFLNDMGSDMISPIWPLFLTSFLAVDMTILGLIDGVGEAVVSISQAVAGFLSDRLRVRKVFIWLGYFLAGISRIGYSLATVWPTLIPFKILDRTGKIRDVPRDAIVADLSGKKSRASNFGLIRAADNLGAVVGILISIFFLGFLGYRRLLFLAALPSLVGAGLIYGVIKEKKKKRRKVYPVLKLTDLSFNFKLFLALSAIFSLGAFSYSFLLIYAKEFGFGVTFIPVLYLFFTAVASLVSYPFGRLSDRLGRKAVLALSFTFWGTTAISFIFLKSILGTLLAFLFYGLHKGSLESTQRAFVAELVRKKIRASALGGFQMMVGIFALPASLIAGILWEKLGLLVPFYFSLIVTALSLALLIFVSEE